MSSSSSSLSYAYTDFSEQENALCQRTQHAFSIGNGRSLYSGSILVVQRPRCSYVRFKISEAAKCWRSALHSISFSTLWCYSLSYFLQSRASDKMVRAMWPNQTLDITLCSCAWCVNWMSSIVERGISTQTQDISLRASQWNSGEIVCASRTWSNSHRYARDVHIHTSIVMIEHQ